MDFNASIPPEGTTGLTLSVLLSRVAQELADGAQVADDCQDALSAVLTAALEPGVIERLQGLDALSQNLIEICALLRRWAATRTEDVVIADDILSPVRLSALLDRLAGRAPSAPGPASVELW